MNLFELKEEKEDVESDIKYYKREIERLNSKVGLKAIKYDKELISGGSGSGIEDALLELAQTGIYLDDAIKKLENINCLVNDKYNNYQNFNDYDKQIYTEKRLFKWSNTKISAKHNGISRMQIWRIINKLENEK